MLVDYESGSPPALPKVPETSPPRATEERSPICPPFQPLIQKYISFCPVEVSQIPEETQSHSKEFFIFAPFQPILPSFGAIEVLRSCRSCADAISQSGPRGGKERQPLYPCCQVLGSSGPQASEGIEAGNPDRGREAQHHPTKRGTQQDQPPRWCRSAPDAASQLGTEAHKERGNATRKGAGASEERGKGKAKKRSDNKPTSPQKEGTPPYCKEQAAVPLITNSRQKISKKSLG